MQRTGGLPLKYAYLLGLFLVGSLLFLTGCKQTTAATEQAAVAGELRESLKTPLASLREELNVLAQNGDTPDLFAREIKKKLHGRISFLAETRKVFEHVDTEPLRVRASKLFGQATLRLTPIEVEALHELRAKYSTQQTKFTELLAQDLPLGLSPHEAYANDFAFLEAFDAAHALLLFTAVESVAARSAGDAIQPLRHMLLLCRKLEEDAVFTSRLHAANLRRRTLRVVASVAMQADRRTLESLAELMREQIAQEIADAELVRRERALGLTVYEQVRQGAFLTYLPQEEYLRLKQEQLLEVTRRSVQRNIDLDETFYLLAMRSLCEAAKQPYFQRISALNQLRDRLAALESSPEYPLLAGKYLLHDCEQVQLAIAQDSALCGGWLLALEAALAGEAPSPMPVNPLTGEAYELVHEGNEWSVRGIVSPAGEEIILVPAQR